MYKFVDMDPPEHASHTLISCSLLKSSALSFCVSVDILYDLKLVS